MTGQASRVQQVVEDGAEEGAADEGVQHPGPLSARAPPALAQLSLAEPDQCPDAAELHASPETEACGDDQEDESSHVIKRYPFLYQCLAMGV
jgi:hypothetical protein